MKVKILFFAQLKDVFHTGERTVEIADSGITVCELVGRLEGLPKALPLRYAVNESFVDEDVSLRDGDVLALLPPVAGG